MAIKHSSDLYWNSNDSPSILLLVSVRSVESMQSLAPSILIAERITIVAIITISYRNDLSLFLSRSLSLISTAFFTRFVRFFHQDIAYSSISPLGTVSLCTKIRDQFGASDRIQFGQ